MNTVIQLAIIQSITFILYVGFIVYRYGIIHSISQSWYELPKNEKWLFTLFLWILAVTVAIYGGPFFFISAIGFGFVGAATMFQEKHTKIVHYIGAGVGILFAYLGMTFTLESPVPMVIYAGVIILEIALRKENVIWWIEIWAFIFLMIGFFS